MALPVIDYYKFMDPSLYKIRKKKSKIPVKTVECRYCRRTGVTLRKCSDGLYICDDCLGKEND